jgi:hypothetical protein
MDAASSQSPIATSPTLWEQHLMAVDRVTDRMQRISAALNASKVPYAVVGGQAVAIWVATRDPAAVRTTKDVDLLVNRSDLPRIRAAALSAGFDYFETMGVGMLLDRGDPNPRHAVHLVWAGEIARSGETQPMPSLDARQFVDVSLPIVSLRDLVLMKTCANRDQDRVHLRDLISVGLIDRALLETLPSDLQPQLDALLIETGI